jgi:hypothetical protein
MIDLNDDYEIGLVLIAKALNRLAPDEKNAAIERMLTRDLPAKLGFDTVVVGDDGDIAFVARADAAH